MGGTNTPVLAHANAVISLHDADADHQQDLLIGRVLDLQAEAEVDNVNEALLTRVRDMTWRRLQWPSFLRPVADGDTVIMRVWWYDGDDLVTPSTPIYRLTRNGWVANDDLPSWSRWDVLQQDVVNAAHELLSHETVWC